MLNSKKLLSLIATLFFCTILLAQPANETTDVMKSNGKIYVVMSVVIVIVLGLFIYLFNLDRKISKIEKQHD
jgi:CcmD family protein